MITTSKIFFILVCFLFFSYTFASESNSILDDSPTQEEKEETSIFAPEFQLKILEFVTGMGTKVDQKEIEKQKIEEEKRLEELEKVQRDVEIKRKKEVFIKQSTKYLSNINVSLDSEIIETIYDKSLIKGIDPYIVFAQIKKESTFNINAYNAGCYGYLQVSKYPVIGYNKLYGTSYTVSDLKKPKVNLELGIEYLRQKKETFGDIHLALMAYNGGEGYLQRSLKAGYKSSSYSRYIVELSKEIQSLKTE